MNLDKPLNPQPPIFKKIVIGYLDRQIENYYDLKKLEYDVLKYTRNIKHIYLSPNNYKFYSGFLLRDIKESILNEYINLEHPDYKIINSQLENLPKTLGNDYISYKSKLTDLEVEFEIE